MPSRSGTSRPSGGPPGNLRQALQAATAGEYEVHHELGRGGMGSVFLAREIGLDRLVAIKVLPPTLMFDEGLIERFQREARMVAKLHHPNIIPVYRVHHSNNLVFYSMHFVPGRSLSEVIEAGRTLTIPEVERIMMEAAAGLGYAHRRGVIHRDVKPANILLDAEGHVHLTDFGIAKALVGNTHLTETGAVIGTPQYMAPEQCESRAIDGRADQYSLAAVAYQLLVGHPPFDSTSVKELLFHHLFSPPKPLNDLRPEVPLSLRDAVHKSLSKDPADRFDTMEDLRNAIEGKGPPVFVKWIDDPAERWRTPPGGVRRRRSTDIAIGDRRRERDGGWAGHGLHDDAVVGAQPIYRRVMGALAVAVVTIAVVGVLALSRGAGLAGSLAQRWSGGVDEHSETLAGVDLGAQAASNAGAVESTFTGGAEPLSGPTDPALLEAESASGQLALQGDLPAEARITVGSEEIDVSLLRMAGVSLPPGEHTVQISAAGYRPFSTIVTLAAGDTSTLQPRLERVEPVRQPQPSGQRVSRTNAPPAVPATLIDRLWTLIYEGEQFEKIGRYVDAGDAYNEVIDRVMEDLGKYGGNDELKKLGDRARKALERARIACRNEGQPYCPS